MALKGLIITGDKALDRALRQLDDKVQKKLGKAAVSAALRVYAKAIKQEVPPSLKSVRKAIGSKYGKARGGPNRGKIQARVGAGVGKKQPKQPKRKESGVGISARNIHWWVLGTGERFDNGRPTGSMPAQGLNIVKDGFAKGTPGAEAKIIQSLRTGIEREARKVKK